LNIVGEAKQLGATRIDPQVPSSMKGHQVKGLKKQWFFSQDEEELTHSNH
jgi:hypothetical protein